MSRHNRKGVAPFAQGGAPWGIPVVDLCFTHCFFLGQVPFRQSTSPKKIPANKNATHKKRVVYTNVHSSSLII